MIYAFSLKRLLCSWVAVLHIVVTTVLAVGPVQAQSVQDNEPPMLDLEVVETGTAGDSQVFSATVTDNDEVLEVVVYLRIQGTDTYERVPMDPIPGTSFYTVTVDVTTDEATVLEYYMNASDVSGNRVVRGFAFDPLVRILMTPEELAQTTEPAAAPTTPTPAPTPPRTGLSTGQKVLFIGLGVLAVGALAAAASSGGGGSGGGDDMPGGGPEIPVLITVDPVAAAFR